MSTESDLHIGRQLGSSWRVNEQIGEGHFSFVMKGTDLATGKSVAIKILRIMSGAESKEELQKEYELLQALAGCDRVVDVRDIGEELVHISASPAVGGASVGLNVPIPFLVLELADACLTDLLVALDQVTLLERISLFRDVVKGIHQMHLKKIVSRDVKSENILLFSGPGYVTTAKVADLGRARRTTDPARNASEAYLTGRGDRRFAPPELLWWQGNDTFESWIAVDLYHLGSVLFELVIGQGLTSMVLPNALAIVQAMSTADPAERELQFRSSQGDLRAKMESAWELFESQIPSAIRTQAGALLRQLTDPIPERRFRRVLGKPASSDKGLEWLLRRVDILSRALQNDLNQKARLSSKKTRLGAGLQ